MDETPDGVQRAAWEVMRAHPFATIGDLLIACRAVTVEVWHSRDAEVAGLTAHRDRLDQENAQLCTTIEDWERQYDALRAEVAALKAENGRMREASGRLYVDGYRDGQRAMSDRAIGVGIRDASVTLEEEEADG